MRKDKLCQEGKNCKRKKGRGGGWVGGGPGLYVMKFRELSRFIRAAKLCVCVSVCVLREGKGVRWGKRGWFWG